MINHRTFEAVERGTLYKQKERANVRKKEKGITLVALVVTIIILLILAGVSINLVFNGEGLFRKANEAVSKYNEAKKEESNFLNNISNYINNYVNQTQNEDYEENKKNVAPVFAQDSIITKGWDSNKKVPVFTVTAKATDENEEDKLTYIVYMKPATLDDNEYKMVATSTKMEPGQNATMSITQYNGANLANYTDYNWKVEVDDGNVEKTIEEGKVNTTKTMCSGETQWCNAQTTEKIRCQKCNRDCTTKICRCNSLY